MNLAKIPATIVTGFLGSGKTTLLSNILKNAAGKRIAVIVNEFGAVDIDATLLKGCALGCEDEEKVDEGIYELANGCICCTVQEEFFPVMQKLVERRDEIDHILIETSGLALPKPLVQAFNWPEIKNYCSVDAVITVVDSPAVAAGDFAADPAAVSAQRQADESLDHDPSLQELFEDQLSAADLVILNKKDLLDNESFERLSQTIQAAIPSGVKTMGVSCGQIDPCILMGLEAAAEDRIESIATHHDTHHHHGEHHDHAHDAFDTVTFEAGEVDGEKLLVEVKQLVDDNTIYRVKAILALPGKPLKQVVQGVGSRFDSYFENPWGNEKRSSKVVLIGKNLSPAQIKSSLARSVI